jgi:hypothetical protein
MGMAQMKKGELTTLTKDEYQRLLGSGMLWEFFPDAKGDYYEDVKGMVTLNKFAIVHVKIEETGQEAILGSVAGGRGKCQYCGEIVNNVAYHSARECEKRPI